MGFIINLLKLKNKPPIITDLKVSIIWVMLYSLVIIRDNWKF